MDELILRCGDDELRSAAILPSEPQTETDRWSSEGNRWTAAHLPLGMSPWRSAEKSIQQDGTFWDGEFSVPIASLYRMSTSGGNGAGVLRTTDPKAKGHASRRNSFLRWSSAAPAVAFRLQLKQPLETLATSRTLSKRLQRLETRMIPASDPLVIQVQYVSPDDGRGRPPD